MKNLRWICVIFLTGLLFGRCNNNNAPKEIPEAPAYRPEKIDTDPAGTYLSPEQSMKTMHLPKGYHLQLVASEPMVQEPVAIAWDGDGRMYVAEMRTYMQDVNGDNENLPTSRIVRLEDTDGDGVMDKKTVFIDSLVLPRMIMTLDDRLVVNETYTYDLWSYRDTNGDGVADEKKLMYHTNEKDTRNLEHQRSGLLWNLDNWIYVSRDPVRYRYANNMLQVDSLPESPGGQWGIAKDNYGRLFFSSAGGETPALDFQQNPEYGALDVKGQLAEGFNAVWPVTGTPDVQGGLMRVRPDSTLNHFTACNGQSVFRGDRLPANLQGNLFICEPVGRLIRRAIVTDDNSKIVLKNAYDKAEFLASTDMNFRPVNTETGPDGCMYIVDMYHGIIQESNWTREGSYLRPRIQRLGLDKNIGRGRIYRLVHDGYTPGPQPRLLEASSSELVGYLDHPNGWWRDNAQKLLIIRGDKSVVPALKKMALGKQGFLDKLAFWKDKPTGLGRLHALWTLEGLGALDKGTLFAELDDQDPHIRKSAVWASEQYLKQGDGEVLGKLANLVSDNDADVKFQLYLSLRKYPGKEGQGLITEIFSKNPGDEMLTASQHEYDGMMKAKALESTLTGMKDNEKDLVLDGVAIFNQLCATCHGKNGEGVSSHVAPPLANQPRVNGDKTVLIKILLNGLKGPVDGKDYPDQMPALDGNNDRWIARVLSYIRNDMGNKASVVAPSEVKAVRDKVGKRDTNWTLKELEK